MSDTAKRKYRVIGDAPFHGYVKDQEFEADFTEAQEARYIARGSIELADGRQNPAESEVPPEVAGGEQSPLDQHFDNDDPDAELADGAKE